MADLQYFEDVEVGAERVTASRLVERDEIIEFATAFDPQPFHIDEAAAKRSLYGGLIASGWHTAAMMMRLLVDDFSTRAATTGSPGFDAMKWLKPVRPGDRIRVRSACIEKIPSKSRPNLGACRFKTEVINQNDETVMSVITIGLYIRRPTATN